MFPKTIKKRKTFLEVSKTGSCFKSKGVFALCKKIDTNDLLVGYTASKKIGNAVLRNFAKRRLRHLVREFCSELGNGFIFVFIATKRTVSFTFSQLRSDFITSFKKVKAFEESRYVI